jgi:tryptophan synthase alpha chain
MRLERALRSAGRKLLVPYLTGGVTPQWTKYLTAYEAAGADAIEIGLPFSDPMIDGSVIQQASDAALSRGVTVAGLLSELATVHIGVPLVAMTYFNLVHRGGPAAFCESLRQAGVSGLIVPDVPLDEADELEKTAAEHDIDLVLLAAPSSSADRLRQIAARSRGFVYAMSLMGTTGVRDELTTTAGQLARTLKTYTDRPVLLGLGISTADHAVAGARDADGIVIGSVLMRQVLDGATPAEVGAWLAGVRAAVDHEFGADASAQA